ncbi:hypothetical protein G6O69_23420 [Pseudenhygromyxa sp. WMMC2535]|uniref:hypothetical protein n=1 Tax=Pseudenhygromyxa sp. WMMC2535 TaxID=2712867 RepID=UPI001557A455|nr:hypothetical protein [Pseudenhygromyxa sp. WMMC2535]NVB40809.1 hypothetical protein [Pseudenhygromyxa sp. WMMC2535]
MRRATIAASLAIAAGLATATLAPGRALAGNEAHVRTPVLWEPSPACGLIVDRSETPLVHLPYSIPAEDTALTADELADSRTHQFFALCRQRPQTALLPEWITASDVARAEAAGLIEVGSVPTSEILELGEWASCALRITPDDARRPITFAQAAQGVDWDTSGASVGVWNVAGYTFEPAFNLWSPRAGFVKIIDDPEDPQQDLPALALSAREQLVTAGVAAELDGCVDAQTPATLHLEWAAFAPKLNWQPIDEIPVTARGALEISWVPPLAAEDLEILIRARLVDAAGRETVAHAPSALAVLSCTGNCPGESSESGPNSEDEAGSEDPVAPGGCALSTGPGRGSGALIFLASLFLWRRKDP